MDSECRNSTLATHVQQYIARHKLIAPDDGVVVALSGGADSVALLLVLCQLGYKCEAAHCNFHLRGDESDRDQTAVEALCKKMNIPLHVRHFNTKSYAQERGVSVEMACRELRYEWFEELRAQLSCRFIAVAHHAGDNIETFFLNALRGTGIAGLGGMKPRNFNIIRPLLDCTREQIEQYLNALGVSHVDDSTNLINDVKRNKLRNIVLPSITEQFPDAGATLQATVEHSRECADLYAEIIGRIAHTACTEGQNGEVIIDANIIAQYENARLLFFEIVKPYGFTREKSDDIWKAAMLNCHEETVFYSRTNVISVKLSSIIIHPATVCDDEEYAVDLRGDNSHLPVTMKITMHEGDVADFASIDGKNAIALDAKVLNCKKVILRHWRKGDRILPFGMKGSKLVSDIFTDAKSLSYEKQKAWILEADGQILWVIGYRASRLYKVSATRTFIEVRCI
ncbi:MAG: tRNA lysidine(34) synthetase TilS [Muribaculaceae bacterium]|nr:tRNA lysidine(34) synthetase TilS [Muribaculaceae bacterium]